LRERILFYDGGMGTQLQARNLAPDDFGGKRWEGCNDYLSLTRPDVVEAVHTAYFEAGADVVETNSFQASKLRPEEWELGARSPGGWRTASRRRMDGPGSSPARSGPPGCCPPRRIPTSDACASRT